MRLQTPVDESRPGDVALRTVVILALFVATTACSNKTQIVGDGGVIQRVEIRGARQLPAHKLIRHLHAAETRWMPFSPDIPHDPALVAVDVQRLEKLYRSEGFLQARVTKTSVIRDDNDVELVFTVVEGRPTRVASLRVQFPTDLNRGAGFVREVRESIALKKGKRFSQARLNRSIGMLTVAMQNRGHPLARAAGQATLTASSRRADVLLKATPGPWARIGKVRFLGRKAVPLYLLRREVRFAIGQPYSPRRVRQMENALKAMRVFRWVTTTRPTKVINGKVDIEFRLNEADPQRIAIGGQLFFDTARWQQQVRADYTHTNVDGHLTRFGLRALVGWAELPDPFSPILHGPVFSFAPSLGRKGLLEDHLYWSLRPAYAVNVREGYQFQQPSNTISVVRWFEGLLKGSVSHNIRYVDFFNVSQALDAGATLLGRDFRDPFTLSFIQARVQLFAANSIVAPTNGLIGDVRYNLSAGVLGSDYDFHEFRFGLRGYIRLGPRIQVATRLRGGMIVPFGSVQPGSPFSYRYYLGGATSVRGWGSRRLSPRVQTCDANDVCSEVPIGGQSFVQANVEARFLAFWKVHLVLFCDAGDVASSSFGIDPAGLHVTVGPGVRTQTVMGKARLDFGYRVVDPGTYPDERPWAIHFGLGETF